MWALNYRFSEVPLPSGQLKVRWKHIRHRKLSWNNVIKVYASLPKLAFAKCPPNALFWLMAPLTTPSLKEQILRLSWIMHHHPQLWTKLAWPYFSSFLHPGSMDLGSSFFSKVNVLFLYLIFCCKELPKWCPRMAPPPWAENEQPSGTSVEKTGAL